MYQLLASSTCWHGCGWVMFICYLHFQNLLDTTFIEWFSILRTESTIPLLLESPSPLCPFFLAGCVMGLKPNFPVAPDSIFFFFKQVMIWVSSQFWISDHLGMWGGWGGAAVGSGFCIEKRICHWSNPRACSKGQFSLLWDLIVMLLETLSKLNKQINEQRVSRKAFSSHNF